MNDAKPCAPAAERNKQAILVALQEILHANDTVFEFGSGTGQHACHIASALPDITWQPSDLPDKLPGIQQWITDSGCSNVFPPVALDLSLLPSTTHKVSVCYTANTLHIISWTLVEQLFTLSANMLSVGGKLCIYGPFKFAGKHCSEGNLQFDKSLRSADPNSGIRDVVDLDKFAHSIGLSREKTVDMPANNQLLVWSLNAPLS